MGRSGRGRKGCSLEAGAKRLVAGASLAVARARRVPVTAVQVAREDEAFGRGCKRPPRGGVLRRSEGELHPLEDTRRPRAETPRSHGEHASWPREQASPARGRVSPGRGTCLTVTRKRPHPGTQGLATSGATFTIAGARQYGQVTRGRETGTRHRGRRPSTSPWTSTTGRHRRRPRVTCPYLEPRDRPRLSGQPSTPRK
jgi:hypothetical protein